MSSKIRLTTKQKAVVNNSEGKFIVKACPGSGKTLVVAAKMKELLSQWEYTHRGIAIMSFTNVAWEEIQKYLSSKFQVKRSTSYPHFLGTIDSFINQYIFLPFAYLVMKCDNRPRLVGPRYDNWEPTRTKTWSWRNHECNANKCKLNDFSYDINGKICNYKPRSHFSNCDSGHKYCKGLKQRFNQKGYATQADANYFAMRIVEGYPKLAKALVYRFPVFMIDEAQDISDIQMRIIDVLIENGLGELVLLGDPDQAVYEWRAAKPTLFLDKFNKWGDNSIVINENWRSSQNICDFIEIISSFDDITAKNSENAGTGCNPEIWSYNDENYRDVIRKFLEFSSESGVSAEPERVAIIARSKNLVNKIKADEMEITKLDPWRNRRSRNFAKSSYLFERGEYIEAFHALMKAPIKGGSNGQKV